MSGRPEDETPIIVFKQYLEHHGDGAELISPNGNHNRGIPRFELKQDNGPLIAACLGVSLAIVIGFGVVATGVGDLIYNSVSSIGLEATDQLRSEFNKIPCISGSSNPIPGRIC